MSIPTEVSPSSEQVSQTQVAPPQSQPTKRSSRRANTAERRATHNAVERLRRETLNGRFLVSIFFLFLIGAVWTSRYRNILMAELTAPLFGIELKLTPLCRT
ncbi:hypothetical protein M408DRAFT_69509 [Serendipita vermifera MAFF 305830]|uniref:BHLH domain-containing protein n=1 Tax=Serendipita vermifera MAFF 305830 TaxID=933852 RepID=A0A0C3B968_SERVB|nr:hypothetical protein M408DRAFT_69509 [Serendipita vermifera MAFF 305830]